MATEMLEQVASEDRRAVMATGMLEQVAHFVLHPFGELPAVKTFAN